MIERLLEIDVSALCDADKSIPVADPRIRAMIPDVRMAGPAYTVVAENDHLPVFAALQDAPAGAVIVIATNGGARAVFGELFATEAKRRGIAGLAVDGLCRDLQGLRKVGLPVFAAGTTPASGTTVSRAAPNQPVQFGGLTVNPGDIVFGDDDGLAIAPPAQVEAALEAAEAIGRAERQMLAAMARGEALHDRTNFHEHVEKLERDDPSSLSFIVYD